MRKQAHASARKQPCQACTSTATNQQHRSAPPTLKLNGSIRRQVSRPRLVLVAHCDAAGAGRDQPRPDQVCKRDGAAAAGAALARRRRRRRLSTHVVRCGMGVNVAGEFQKGQRDQCS